MSKPESEGLVDWGASLNATGGNEKLLAELIEIFFDEYPKLLAGIRSAIEDRSAKDLQRCAHTLKGCLRYFGETPAGALSSELETMGLEKHFASTQTVLDKLVPEINRLLPELRAYIRDR